MADDLPQTPANPPPSKNRSALKLLSLLVLAAGLTVIAVIVTVKAIQRLPFNIPAGWIPGNQSSTQISVSTEIKKFKNYEELANFLAAQRERPSGRGFSSPLMRSMDAVEEFEMPQNSWGAPPGGLGATVNQGLQYSTIVGWGTSASDDYSRTNVQVVGVDEADVVKTDGQYLYAVAGQNLFIVRAYPPEQGEVISLIKFDSTPQDIFINGDALVVFGHNNVIQSREVYKKFKRRSNYTFFKVFDISDRANPRQVRDVDFEGSYFNARMIDNYVYLLTTSPTTYYAGEPPIPRILENGVELPIAPGEPRCNCPDVYYFDPDEESYTYTSVAAINVVKHAEAVSSDVYLLSAGQSLYVSPTNLYLTYTKRLNPEVLAWEVLRDFVLPLVPERDRTQIAKIEAVDVSILSRAEKFQKISEIIERWAESLTADEQKKIEDDLEAKLKLRWQEVSQQLEQTVIHKIGIDGRDLKYLTYGAVPGYVLNQFSMDEHDGYFRIATTRSRQWGEFGRGSQDSYSNLYVLDKNLKLAGKVEELAPGEQIFSVRFMQNRGYLVTFRQTDPLFAVDLSDPRNPRVLGKLKIPGFSDYLHPYDDATLIGLGQESGKLKLSLFDVADVAHPDEIAKYLFDEYGSDSIARKNHKAFLFSKEKNLLVIPVTLRERIDEPIPIPCPRMPCRPGGPCPSCSPTISYRYESFQGAAVFSVDRANGFTLRGKIKHGENTAVKAEIVDWNTYQPPLTSAIKRSLYIEDVLYTLSDQYLKANRLGDLSELKYLKLEKKSSEDFEIIN